MNVGNLGNLGGMGFGAAPVCSETFTMAEDLKASAVGEKTSKNAAKNVLAFKPRIPRNCLIGA